MNFRRAAKEDYIPEAKQGSLKNLFATMRETDVWLNMGL